MTILICYVLNNGKPDSCPAFSIDKKPFLISNFQSILKIILVYLIVSVYIRGIGERKISED